MDLKGHVAVVTGASRGVGQKIAEALEERGMVVASVARSAVRFAADVSDPEDVARLKTAVEAELGEPTVVVNAAGIFGPIALVKDGEHFMIAVVPACRHVRLGILSRLLRRRIGLATEAEASALFTDCDPGAFPAVGGAYGLEMVVDDSLLRDRSDTYLEGGDHSSLVHLAPGDFEKLTEGATLGRFSAHD